jgi:hypothetical protein
MNPSVAWSGSVFLSVWNDGRGSAVTGQDVYGTRLSAAGGVLDVNSLAIAATTGTQGGGVVAWDGTNFVVAWVDASNPNGVSVFAQRISEQGVTLDATPIRVAPVGTTGTSTRLSIASNHANTLIAWVDLSHGGNVMAQRLSPAGALLDGNGIVIGSSVAGLQVTPVSAASDGTGYLIAWTKAGSPPFGGPFTVMGRRLLGDGTFPPSTAEFLVRSGAYNPSVAWGGTAYGVVSQPTTSANILGFVRVDASGTVLDPTPVALWSMGTTSVGDAHAVWTGTEFMVVFSRPTLNQGTPDFDLYGTRVSAAGALVTPSPFAIFVSPAWDKSAAVAFNGANVLAVWNDTTPGAVLGAMVTPTGTSVGTSGFTVSLVGSSEGAGVVGFDGTNYLVAWTDRRKGRNSIIIHDDDIHAARVSPNGVVLDSTPIAVSEVLNGQVIKDIAFNGTEYLLVWEDTRASTAGRSVTEIYAARVTRAGVVLDANGLALSSPGCTNCYSVASSPRVASDGTDFFVTWTSGGHVDGARVPSTGAPDAQRRLVMTTDGQTSPSVAHLGIGYLLVWQNTPSGAGADVMAKRLTSTGADVGTAFVVSNRASDETAPLVQVGGGQALVVWNDTRNGAGDLDVFGARIDASGALLDPAGISLLTGAGTQRPTTLSYTGTSFALAWQTPALDSVLTRIDSSGTRIDATPFSLATPSTTAPFFGVGPAGQGLASYVRNTGGMQRARGAVVTGL